MSRKFSAFVTTIVPAAAVLAAACGPSPEVRARLAQARVVPGVEGVVLEDYPITVLITKQTERGKRVVPVTYYPFLVTAQVDDWPEKDRRQRHWAGTLPLGLYWRSVQAEAHA